MDFLTRNWENPQAVMWARFDEVDELIERANARLQQDDQAGANDFIEQAHRRLEQVREQDGEQLYEAVCEKIGQLYGIPPKDIPRSASPDWLSFS
jgi:DNA repair ATPase RecN